jgi:hypothetical protein
VGVVWRAIITSTNPFVSSQPLYNWKLDNSEKNGKWNVKMDSSKRGVHTIEGEGRMRERERERGE